MTASWSKTIQSVLACSPRVLFLPTKQSARPIYSHDNATWKSSIPEKFFTLRAHQTHRLSTWRFSWPYELGPCESYRQTVCVFDRSLTMVDRTYLKSARKHSERKHHRTLWLTKTDVEPLSNSGMYAKITFWIRKRKIWVSKKSCLFANLAPNLPCLTGAFSKSARSTPSKIETHFSDRARLLAVQVRNLSNVDVYTYNFVFVYTKFRTTINVEPCFGYPPFVVSSLYDRSRGLKAGLAGESWAFDTCLSTSRGQSSWRGFVSEVFVLYVATRGKNPGR